MLTARQQEIWQFLVDYVDRHGYPPTVREIGEAVGLASPSTVHAHLANLERAGLLRRDPTKPRALDLIGHGAGYELEDLLAEKLPRLEDPEFRAHFLVDYAEEMFLTPEGRAALERLPNIDVCVRHTKLQVSGGWIPTRMLRSSYVYSQNGTLFSNWEPDELVALAAVALLAKKLMSGEILSKAYLDIDDVKRRFQLRELNLFQRTVKLRPEPRKLFVVGSPIGLYQVYY